MSEFIAEAQVLVRPDTSKFRAELQAQLLTATKGVTIPVTIVPSVKGAAITTGFARLTEVQNELKQKSLETSGAMQSIDKAAKKNTQSLLGVNNAASRLNAGLLGLRTALGSTAVIGLGAVALAAIAAGQAVRAAVINFAAFEQELNTFRVVTGATAEQMETVRQTAIALGEDIRLPGVSAADAAIALTELSKAGLSVQESLDGVEGVLQLATAASISNADAALIAANALNAFGLAGSEATTVADALANAANASQGSISDFGLALKQSAAVARQVGLSLQDTTALLSLFAKSGLQGSDAGTSLRVALIRLINPTKAARAEIEKLQLNLRDVQGNLRADIFAQFGEATAQLTPKARDAAAAIIFGTDAIRAASIGAREGADNLRIMQFQIEQQGTAAEVAAARTEGLAGALAALQNAGQGLSITFGKLISGPLGETARNFAIVAASIDKLIRQNERLGPSTLDQNSKFDQLSAHLRDIAKTVLVPGAGFAKLALLLDSSARAAAEADEKYQKLNSQLQNLQDARILIAKALSPDIAEGLTSAIKGVQEQITALERESQGLSATVNPLRDAIVLLERVRDVRLDLDLPVTSINIFIRALEQQAAISEQTQGNINRLRDDVGDLGTNSRNAAGGVDALTKALKQLGRQSAVADAALLKLQNENAGPAAIIANRQADIQTQKQIIADLKKNGNQPGDASTITAAREKIEADQAEIANQQGLIATAAKKASDDAKKKADDIQKAREEGTRALIESFTGRGDLLQEALSRAQNNENFKKQIAINKAIIANDLKEIAALKARIKHLHLHGDALKAAQAAIAAANKEIRGALDDIAQEQEDQQERIRETINRKLDLRIQIAEALGDTPSAVAAQIKAHRAKLAQITKELVAAKRQYGKNSVQWLELRAAQAEEIARIKELEGEAKKKAQVSSSFFTFLQTQSGFAANLLGNLIPGFATRGLVGGGSSAGPAAGAAFSDLGASPGKGVQQTAAIGASQAAGVRPVQVDTTNQLLRQILAAVSGRGRPAPETVHNRRVGSAMMDTLGGIHGA